MAKVSVDFYSDCLKRIVTFQAVLPNDVPPMWITDNPHFQRRPRNLYLLHGFSGTCTDWINSSQIVDLANQYNLAVICPGGENGFYLDSDATGRKYASFTGEELPRYVQKTFGLLEKAEDNYIGGLSMGGFGAIHTALLYNHRFSKAFGLSSALIQHDIENMKPGESNEVANYEYYAQVFGDLEQMDENPNNPEVLVRQLKENNEKIPGLYLACGTEDGLCKNNRDFRYFLEKEQVPFTYLESPGVHNWTFWNQYLEPAIQWLLED